VDDPGCAVGLVLVLATWTARSEVGDLQILLGDGEEQVLHLICIQYDS
jgi:hypothetical protein